MNESGRFVSLRVLMRLILLAVLTLASCAPSRPASGTASPGSPPAAAPASSAEQPPQVEPETASHPRPPESPLKAPALVRANLSGIAIEAVSFDSRSHFLAVADQTGGPASMWPDARAAGRAKGAIAAVNGGFFTPEGEPLGRLVSQGQSRGQLNRASSLGAGFYVRESSGSMSLLRRQSFQGGSEALQSGPFLVENGRPVSGLSTKQSTARTFVAWDGGSRWLIARTGSCSLNVLAAALAGASIGPTPLTHVLNLDGGRSSEIWVSTAVAGGPTFTRPIWNKPVRNYLILRPRG